MYLLLVRYCERGCHVICNPQINNNHHNDDNDDDDYDDDNDK